MVEHSQIIPACMRRNMHFLRRFSNLGDVQRALEQQFMPVDFVQGYETEEYNDIRPLTLMQARVCCLSVRIASSARSLLLDRMGGRVVLDGRLSILHLLHGGADGEMQFGELNTFRLVQSAQTLTCRRKETILEICAAAVQVHTPVLAPRSLVESKRLCVRSVVCCGYLVPWHL
jgi:hypothetical protein